MNKNRQFFIRYTTSKGQDRGLTCFGSELDTYLTAIVKRGAIVTGVEFYKE